jgi:hypothetical protein
MAEQAGVRQEHQSDIGQNIPKPAKIVPVGDDAHAIFPEPVGVTTDKLGDDVVGIVLEGDVDRLADNTARGGPS